VGHWRRVATGAGVCIAAVWLLTALGGGAALAADSSRPVAMTDPASNVTSTSATLNGVAGPGFPIVQATELGNAATYVFQYGTSTTYGSQTPTGIVTSTQSVSAGIAALTPCTAYHFRIVASEAGSTTDGADMTLTTAPDNPELAVKAPKRARHGHRLALRLTLGAPAHVTVFITRRGHDVRTITEGLHQVGAFTARIRAPRKAGRYGLRIVATANCASQTVSRRLRVR
jgi:hypothetical protein